MLCCTAHIFLPAPTQRYGITYRRTSNTQGISMSNALSLRDELSGRQENSFLLFRFFLAALTRIKVKGVEIE